MVIQQHITADQKVTACAPAKLILSGEHSVLYAQPAIALAVNRYTSTTITWRDTPHINFRLLDFSYTRSYTSSALRNIATKLQREYHNFLQGQCSISSVLKRPVELLQYAVANLFATLNVNLTRGIDIEVSSNIPIGCGMGSSAAAVASTIYSLTSFLDHVWEPAEYLTFSREIENLQHGRSSGLDLQLVTAGGCARFQNGVTQMRPSPNFPLHIVNTGQPTAATGESVTHVAPLMQDIGLANAFGAVTDQIDAAILHDDIQQFKVGIQANQQLLQRIGVVPNKVANFIADIESVGGVAKVCGAGSVSGDNAGIVLVLAEPEIAEVVQHHGYKLQTLQVDTDGIRII